MKIKDCEVGKEVIRTGESFGAVKKGETYTISSWIETNVGYPNTIKFEELSMGYDMNKFELKKPANKYEIGDEVIYNPYISDTLSYSAEGKIFGVATKKDCRGRKYAVIFTNEEGKIKLVITAECDLSPRKKKNELEVGDKFKTEKNIYKILFVGYDDYYNQKEYYCKQLNNEYKGATTILFSRDVDEIIYE